MCYSSFQIKMFLIKIFVLTQLLDNYHYNIPINDTTVELFVFWPSDTESRINKLRFSDSVSLSFKTRVKSVTCFYVK